MIDSSENFHRMKKEVYGHMLKTRGPKYTWFLRALRSFKYASLSPTRGNLLESYYTVMRYGDDIVDGDAPLPEGYTSSVDYVKDRMEFSKNLKNPYDPADYLLAYSFELAEKLGFSIHEENIAILSSMLFDAERVGKNKIFTKDELYHHFHLLDIEGTIKGAIKVFKGEPHQYSTVEPLGIASRIYYVLRDYDDDIKAGFINIPQEDIEKYRINSSDLGNRLSDPIQNWFRDESQKGLKLIDEYHDRMTGDNIKLIGKITLKLVYERPARKYFEKILNESNVK